MAKAFVGSNPTPRTKTLDGELRFEFDNLSRVAARGLDYLPASQ